MMFVGEHQNIQVLVARGSISVEAYSIALVCTGILEKLDCALPIFVFFCLSVSAHSARM